MQRRIEKPNRGPQTLERGRNPDEIFTLIRQQLRQRSCPLLLGARENHLAHGVDTVAFKKHVLSAAKSDAFSAECDSIFDLFRRVGICANAERPELIYPIH